MFSFSGYDFKIFVSVMLYLGIFVGIVGAIVIFFGFMTKKNEHRFHGIFEKLYDFLHFKKYLIEGILKFGYTLGACVCTSAGIFLMVSVTKFFWGVFLLVVGNLLIRLGFEVLMLVVLACRNISDINNKMGKNMPAESNGETVQAEIMVSQIKPEIQTCPGCGRDSNPDDTFCCACGKKLL